MKIVMDFRKYDGVIGGVEQGVVQITKNLTANEQSVVLLCKKKMLHKTNELFDGVPNLKIIPLDTDTHSMSKLNAHIDSIIIPDIAEKLQADIIHFPYNWSFPSQKKVPTILTIHDVIPFTFREAMGLYRNLFKYKPGIKKACRLNDVVVTISEFSKQDIAEKVGTPKEKIRIIPNGLRKPFEYDKTLEQELVRKYELNNEFILNVGGIHKRKNIVRLIYAFALLVNKYGYKGKLLITGSVSGAPYQNKMKKICDSAVSKTGMHNRIIFTGFITDNELDILFKLTDFLIYPSLYEGFGIPILEGMQAGVPVITSNVTAMPEVAKNAAILVNPYDINDIAGAMAKLLDDKKLREELVKKGKKRASEYSWEKTSEMYLALFKEVSKC